MKRHHTLHILHKQRLLIPLWTNLNEAVHKNTSGVLRIFKHSQLTNQHLRLHVCDVVSFFQELNQNV